MREIGWRSWSGMIVYRRDAITPPRRCADSCMHLRFIVVVRELVSSISRPCDALDALATVEKERVVGVLIVVVNLCGSPCLVITFKSGDMPCRCPSLAESAPFADQDSV